MRALHRPQKRVLELHIIVDEPRIVEVGYLTASSRRLADSYAYQTLIAYRVSTSPLLSMSFHSRCSPTSQDSFDIERIVPIPPAAADERPVLDNAHKANDGIQRRKPYLTVATSQARSRTVHTHLHVRGCSKASSIKWGPQNMGTAERVLFSSSIGEITVGSEAIRQPTQIAFT
jgi:hypothetical protein